MIKETLEKLVRDDYFTPDEYFTVVDEVIQGKATQAQIAALMTLLYMKAFPVPEKKVG